MLFRLCLLSVKSTENAKHKQIDEKDIKWYTSLMNGRIPTPEGGSSRGPIREFFSSPRNRIAAGIGAVVIAVGAGLDIYAVSNFGEDKEQNPNALVEDPYAALTSPTGEPVKITASELARKKGDEVFTAVEKKNYFDDAIRFFDGLNNFKAKNAYKDEVEDISQAIIDKTEYILDATGGDKYISTALKATYDRLLTDKTKAELAKAGITVSDVERSKKGLQSSGVVKLSGGNGQTKYHVQFITPSLRLVDEFPDTPVAEEAVSLQSQSLKELAEFEARIANSQ